MFYVGIDIAKNTHEAAILGDTGEPIGATLKIPNTTAGAQKLLQFLEQRLPEQESFCVGMEATGHYWLAL